MMQYSIIVLPGLVLSLVPGIHGNRQGVCRGSCMAGPSAPTTIEKIVCQCQSTSLASPRLAGIGSTQV